MRRGDKRSRRDERAKAKEEHGRAREERARVKLVPADEAEPILRDAEVLRAEGVHVYACAVLIAHTSGGGAGTGGKWTTKISRFNPSWLIEQLERSGWRLENIDHVWMQTSQNNSITGNFGIIEGFVEAQMLFRRD